MPGCLKRYINCISKASISPGSTPTFYRSAVRENASKTGSMSCMAWSSLLTALARGTWSVPCASCAPASKNTPMLLAEASKYASLAWLWSVLKTRCGRWLAHARLSVLWLWCAGPSRRQTSDVRRHKIFNNQHTVFCRCAQSVLRPNPSMHSIGSV